jgi:hypothetical protein
VGGTVLDRWKRQIPDEELLNLSPEELCKDRQSEEYFRGKCYKTFYGRKLRR